MALALKDRVKETTIVVGTGAATLLGSSIGFQPFSVVGNGNTTYYCISDQFGSNWEVGIGTYSSSGNTLARTTVLASSNGGALVVFTAGVKDVFVTYPAEKGVWLDASNNAIGLGTPAAFVGTNITGTASGLTAGNVTTNANLTGAITSSGNATSLGSFTSLQLATALTDETGSGAAVFATSPTLVTPALGTPTSGTLTNCTLPQLTASTGSTLVGTTITGAGSVTRTVASKLNDVISVKDFGATGDGVTDDTAAISLAITSNRTVHFPAGTYIISSRINKIGLNNVVLSGEGKDISIIKCSAAASFTNSPISFDSCSYVEIKDLTVDQNNNPSITAIYPLIIIYQSTNVAIRNCHINRYTYIAIAIGSCQNISIENNIIDRDTAINTTSYSINLFSPSTATKCTNGIIRGNICNKGNSIYSGNSLLIHNNIFTNYKYGAGINTSCELDDATYGNYIITNNTCNYGTGVDSDGVNVAGMEILGFYNLISGNTCVGNGGVGIALIGYKNTVTNNVCIGNGTNLAVTDNYRSGILVGVYTALMSGSFNFITGNKCFDAGAGSQKYGYYEDTSTLQGITLSNNDFTGTTAPTFIQSINGNYQVNNWVSYTPVMTSGTGTITTVGACTGSYRRNGNMIFLRVSCAITTNGTGAGYITITLPIVSGASGQASYMNGRENGVTGKMLLGYTASSATLLRVTLYDGTYPGANNAVMALYGSYYID